MSAHPLPSHLVHLLDQANLLKRLPRTGWLLAGAPQPESVADHSFGVGVLALFLAEWVNQDPSREGLERPLDVGRVVILALLHDLAESALTDLPKRASQLIGEQAKHRAEQQVMDALLAPLPGGAGYRALWAEYDAVSSPEARLVKDADKLEMVHQAIQYARQGVQGLEEFHQGHHWHYRASQALFQFLCDSA